MHMFVLLMFTIVCVVFDLVYKLWKYEGFLEIYTLRVIVKKGGSQFDPYVCMYVCTLSEIISR